MVLDPYCTFESSMELKKNAAFHMGPTESEPLGLDIDIS